MTPNLRLLATSNSIGPKSPSAVISLTVLSTTSSLVCWERIFEMLEPQWQKQGATLSHLNACNEFGLPKMKSSQQ